MLALEINCGSVPSQLLSQTGKSVRRWGIKPMLEFIFQGLNPTNPLEIGDVGDIVSL